MLLGAYAIPALTKNKTQFFGLGFHTFLLFLAVLTLRYLLLAERLGWTPAPWLRRARAAGKPGASRPGAGQTVAVPYWPGGAGAVRPWAQPWARGLGRSPLWLVSAGLVLVTGYGVVSFSWPTRIGDASADWLRNRRQIVEGVYAAVINGSHDHANSRVFVTCVGDVNRSVLNYMAYRDIQPVAFYDVPYGDNASIATAEFDRADMVVAAEAGSGLIADFLPNYKIQDKLLADLRAPRTSSRPGGSSTSRRARGFTCSSGPARSSGGPTPTTSAPSRARPPSPTGGGSAGAWDRPPRSRSTRRRTPTTS